MDTTTVYTAALLMGCDGDLPPGSFVTAMSLLDLNQFVESVVLHSSVFYLNAAEDLAFEINEVFREPVVIPLPVHAVGGNTAAEAMADLYETIRGELLALYETANGATYYETPRASAVDDIRPMLQAWSALTERPLTAADLCAGWKARDHQWSSVPLQALRQLTSAELRWIGLPLDFDPDPVRDLEVIEECNVRSLFSQRIAGMLNLPYAPNTARLPFRQSQFAAAQSAHVVALDMRVVQTYLAERPRSYLPPHSVALPPLLATVLERSDCIGDILPAVADLRAKYSGYRSRRAELLDALDRGDLNVIERLQRALDRDHLDWRREGAALGVAAVMAALSHGVSIWLPRIMRVVAGAPEERREAILSRFLRPEEWFMTDVAFHARSLGNALPRIRHLWAPDARVLGTLEQRLGVMAHLQ